MIIDKIENLKNYASVNPLFPKVVEFMIEGFPQQRSVSLGSLGVWFGKIKE